MINDERLPLISFTGSIRVGKRVAQQVAGRLGRSILELGGNNGIIVSADADLDMATRAIVFGAVGTAGQRCTSTRRLIVQRSIVDELCEGLVRAYRTVPIGDPMRDGVLMGPLINGRAVETMMKAVDLALAEDGEVLDRRKTLAGNRRELRRANHHSYAAADAARLRGNLRANLVYHGLQNTR